MVTRLASTETRKTFEPMITQDEAKQLRIGNYVTYHSDEGDMESRLIGLDVYNIAEDRMGNCEAHSFIPLSEELLLRLGAEKINHIHGYSFYSFSKSKINKCHIDIFETRTEWMGYMIEHCKYLHQLQNAFKVFTSQELTLKP